MLCQLFDTQARTGLTQDQHRLKAMQLLFHDQIQIDWYRRKVESVTRAQREGIKELCWSGATNSMKTTCLAAVALTKWWENPDSTTIYIASPYKHATQTNLWARIVEQFSAAKERHPHLPGRLVSSQAKIVQYDRNPLSFIQVVTVDEIGKLVGKKSRRFNEGLFVIMIDESPNLPGGGTEMMQVLDNLRGVPNFLLIYAGNFADTMDFMGRMAEPPGGYESLKGQEDTLREYYTKRRGLVCRFDGHDSENYHSGKDIYDFITTLEYLGDLAHTTGGTSSPGYMRFARSFPVFDVGEFRVTNLGKIEAGGAETAAKFTDEELVLISFCDPGFGGDACVVQDLRFGFELREGRRRQVLELDGPPITVPIDVNLRDSNGVKVSADTQIVMWHKAHCEAKGIPAANSGFDGSMRSGIVHAYASQWSVEVVPIDSQGEATERIFDPKNKKRWRDEVFNFTSEHWFSAGLLIQSGQLRGLQNSPAAKEQLCKRPWLWKGDRKQIQPKIKFKADNQSKSPNEADAVCGGIELARRRGMSVTIMQGPGVGAIRMFQEMRERRAKMAEVKRILGGNKLQRGQLHGIQLASTNGRHHLNS